MTSLKSLNSDYSSKNHVRKFLCALPLKWRANVTTIEEAKDLGTLPFYELIENLKVEQTSDNSDSQGGSNEDIDEEEEIEAFNLLDRNFRRGNSFEDKGGESSKKKGACYNCGIEGHFASECRKPKENKPFIEGAWSNSEDGDKHQNDATCCTLPEMEDRDMTMEEYVQYEIEKALKNGKVYSWETTTYDMDESVFVTSSNKGFTAALDVLVIEASQSKQHVEAIILKLCPHPYYLSTTEIRHITSASADDIAVQSCIFEIQLTNLSSRNCIPPDVLLRESMHPAWSASEKAVSSNPESFEY
ncbi:zf-CCHC domain-containing protein [Tanacetum coccineum]|uniref:Zf-CCHC domain-containing protein n=1 Tax=Tanacetum coccineum TaxID=301880 RepID=A0ABQ5H3M4_9ASTR